MADLAVLQTRSDGDLQVVTADDLLRGRPVLVLAPHPDDESLACGGLLAAAFQPSGSGAHVVCLTNGSASHPASRSVTPADLADLRRRELGDAVNQLGGSGSDVTWIGSPDSALVAHDTLVHAVVELVQECAAGLVLAPSPLDPHCDHVAGAEIGRRVVQLLPGLRLGFYPVWSRWHGGGTAPCPPGTQSVRFLTAPYRVRKAAAIAAHRSQQGMVVDDDPDGFEMPPGFATFFGERDEVYFLCAQEGLG